MGSLASCGTSIIVLINTIFGLVGLVFLIAGIMVKHFPDTIETVMSIVKAKLKDMIPEQSGIDIDSFSVTQFIGGAATPFTIIGVVLLAIVVWAYCGTLCKSKWMLIVYSAILCLIIIGEIVCIVLFITKRDMMDSAVKGPMKESLVDFYAGDNALDGTSMGWNAVMGLLDCCGVDGYEDFNYTTAWNRTYGAITLETPVICCENPAPTCSIEGQSNNYKSEGCYDALWDMIDDNKSIVIGILVGVGVFQVLLLIFVIIIIKSLSKSDKKVHPE